MQAACLFITFTFLAEKVDLSSLFCTYILTYKIMTINLPTFSVTKVPWGTFVTEKVPQGIFFPFLFLFCDTFVTEKLDISSLFRTYILTYEIMTINLLFL